jgi:hypothetical protein
MQSCWNANRHGRKDSEHRSVVEGGIRDGRFRPVDHAGQASMIGKDVLTAGNRRDRSPQFVTGVADLN